MKKTKKIIMIGLSVAGAVIGAGFATGKEIMLFFPQKGLWGIISILFSLFLMAVSSLLFCFRRRSENKILTIGDKIFECIFTFFVAASFSVMLSCGGETINESLGISSFIGVIFTYIICILITNFNLKGVYIFNLIASPLMIICTVIVSIKGLTAEVFFNTSPALLSVSYCGLNLLSLIPFLKALKLRENDDKSFLGGTFFGITAVLICGIFIKLVTDKYSDILINAEIPMLKIALTNRGFIGVCYSILIYCAILTTAVSCLFALKEKGNVYIITLPLLFTAFLGFESLIKNIYGFFGYIGAVFIIYILLTVIFEKKE